MEGFVGQNRKMNNPMKISYKGYRDPRSEVRGRESIVAWSAGVPPVEEETPPKMGAPLTTPPLAEKVSKLLAFPVKLARSQIRCRRHPRTAQTKG